MYQLFLKTMHLEMALWLYSTRGSIIQVSKKRTIKQFLKCGVAFPKCACIFSDFQLLEEEDNIFLFYLITCWNFSFKNEIESWLTTVWYKAQAINLFWEQNVLCILKIEIFHVVVSEMQKLQSLILEYQETAIMMHIHSILQVYLNLLQYNCWLYCHAKLPVFSMPHGNRFNMLHLILQF